MGYSSNEGMVRVDVFKSSGKWYQTLEVDMSDFYHEQPIHGALKKSISISEGSHFLEGGHYFFVCLEPHHVFEHPITLNLHP